MPTCGDHEELYEWWHLCLEQAQVTKDMGEFEYSHRVFMRP